MVKKYICIACPIGCHLELEEGKEQAIKVTGNKCKKGEIYAREENFAPKRVVTATCPSNSKISPRIPVKTDQPILKEHIDDLLHALYEKNISIPVRMNDVIIQDFKKTGINIVATKSVQQ